MSPENAIQDRFDAAERARNEQLDLLERLLKTDRNRRNNRQKVLFHWIERAFGQQCDTTSVAERRRRFLEEALELFQAAGGELADVVKFAEHVFSKPVGEVSQEVGGVSVTLLTLCEAFKISAELCEQTEMDRVLSKDLEHFRQRNAAKRAAGLGDQNPNPNPPGEINLPTPYL